MPFTFTPKSAGDLIRSQDWNAAMTAIAALFDKLSADATLGHTHDGTPENGPLIGSNGLQNAAVTLQKLADLAVSAAKLQDGAVTNAKIGNGAVTSAKIATGAVGTSQMAANSVNATVLANGAVGAAQLASNSVSTAAIQNGAVTAAKLASGVAPEIGIAISNVGHGQTAAIPSGFLVSECRFMCALKYVQMDLGATGTHPINATINTSTRVVGISNSSVVHGVAVVMALGKKGGW